jgi:hypothetical protein
MEHGPACFVGDVTAAHVKNKHAARRSVGTWASTVGSYDSLPSISCGPVGTNGLQDSYEDVGLDRARFRMARTYCDSPSAGVLPYHPQQY